MKITITEIPSSSESEITVRASTDELDEILSALSFIGKTVTGKKDGERFSIPLSSVFYFETVDDHLFFCTERETFECPTRLKQIEEKIELFPFSRISRTVIVNVNRLRSIRPEKNGRLIASLTNGEKLVVNRQYVKVIKEKLGV